MHLFYLDDETRIKDIQDPLDSSDESKLNVRIEVFNDSSHQNFR
jgi:hypothetical protein